jgi:hypothetical protein
MRKFILVTTFAAVAAFATYFAPAGPASPASDRSSISPAELVSDQPMTEGVYYDAN